MFLLIGAFIAGVITVLAPCVLPLLPVIIGGSVTGNVKDRRRPLIITAALAGSLILFTVLLKITSALINLPPRAVAYLSGGIIIAVGVVSLFPMGYALILGKAGIERRAQGALAKGFQSKRAIAGPVIIGAALGPVFSSCSPVYAYILATVLPANGAQAAAYIVAYVSGLSLVLLLVGYYGQRFVGKVRFASNPAGWFQRTIAILFIVVGLLICTGYDKRLQVWVADHTPFNFDGISAKFLPRNKHLTTNTTGSSNDLFNVTPYQAPEFVGLQGWINSQPLTMQELRGKVVLIDFWTYSCINCIRNNPHLERWYTAYKDDGFVVVGIHAPEFSFEKVPANVRQGVADQHITYPVALDNNLATWNAFSNAYWPAGYLIDAQGNVRRLHEGEGQYPETEQAIRALLQENGARLGAAVDAKETNVPISVQQTPETYVGYGRAQHYAGQTPLEGAGVRDFTMPTELGINYWALSGSWETEGEKITARGNSTLRFHVAAKDVYVVGGTDSPAPVTVLLDGKPISETEGAGSDVQASTVRFNESRLYHIVSLPDFSSDHTVELRIPAGVSLNAFTFGS